MSCRHGNHEKACDVCDEVDAAYEAGKKAAQSRLDSVEMPPDAVNEPQEVLMGMSLLRYAHDMRMRACSAWSDARDTKGDTNQANCDEAAAFEGRLKSAINEMAEAYDTLRQHCAALSVKCAEMEKDARDKVLDLCIAKCVQVESGLKKGGLNEQAFGAGDCVANLQLMKNWKFIERAAIAQGEKA
jgi:hypothetical protein